MSDLEIRFILNLLLLFCNIGLALQAERSLLLSINDLQYFTG